MTKYTENLLLGLLLALGLNHFVLGMAWLPSYQHSGPVLLGFGLYLLALVFSIYGQPVLRLTAIQAYLNLAISLAVPLLVLSELPIASAMQNGSYQTWFIAGIGLILAITTGRGWPYIGVIGTASLWVIVVVWGGPAVITTSGLIGATLLVAVAWGLGRGLRSTGEAAATYHLESAELTARATRSIAARTARQQMLQSTMLTGMPMLELIRDAAGKLSDVGRSEAILLEHRLRDEIQGHNLLNDGVRLATRDARKRGVEVSFNDEGGLDHIDLQDRVGIHQSIIQAINGTQSGKILISAPRAQNYSVSIIATRPEAAAPDLWLRLP